MEDKQARDIINGNMPSQATDLPLFAEELLQDSAEKIDFQALTERVRVLSGAKYASFNLFDDNGLDFTTVAVAGLPKSIETASDILGFDIVGKKWKHDPQRTQKIADKIISRFASIRELTGNVLPPLAVAFLEKTFSIGEVVIVKIMKDAKTIGDFTLLFVNSTTLKNEDQVEIYTRMIGLFLTRSKAEQKNKQALERLQLLFAAIPDAVIVSDFESGRIFDVNDGFVALSGYAPNEVIGKSTLDIAIWDSQEKRQIFAEKLRIAGALNNEEMVFRLKNGTLITTLVSARIMIVGDTRCIISIARDISMRKIYEKELLRRSTYERVLASVSTRFINPENYHSSIDDSLREIGLLVDAHRAYLFQFSENKPVLIRTNEWCAKILEGKSKTTSQIATDAIPWLIDSLNYGKIIQIDNIETMPAEACAEMNIFIKQDIKAVMILPVFIGRSLIGFVGMDNVVATGKWRNEDTWFLRIFTEMLSNLIARSRAQAALERKQAELKTIYDNVPMMLCLLDENRRVLQVNRQLCDFTNRTNEKLVGGIACGAFGCVHAHEDPKGCGYGQSCNTCMLRCAIDDSFKNGKGYSNVEYKIQLLRDNIPSDVILLCTTAMVNASGTPQLLFCFQDVTGLRRAEEEKRKMEEQYFQSQKMEAIGMLAGGIAHDLNNMLGAILGYAEMIKTMNEDENEIPKDTVLDKKACTIISATNRAADLVGQLLAFSRQGKYQNISIDLHAAIKEVVKLLEHSLDKKISIATAFQAESSVIQGDPTQIHNTILNLAVNARDAMPEGGTLRFETTSISLDDKFTALHSLSLKPGVYVCMAVIDTGEGMDEETKKKLFQPYFTTKPTGKGTGLGLASVYGTVRNHGGFIEVQSEKGHGSVFRIYLPCAEQYLPSDTQQRQDNLHKGSGRIIVVDDEEYMAQMTRDFLGTMGYDAIAFTDSFDAVEEFKKNHDIIDLVILDMIMPRQNGYECFRMLREIDTKAKVIISTGYADDTEVKKAIEEGVLAVIHKPFDRKKLSAVVQEAIHNTLSSKSPISVL